MQDLVKSPTEFNKHYPQINLNSVFMPTISVEHQRDIYILTKILEYAHINSLHYYLDSSPKLIHENFLFAIEDLLKIRQDPTFYLYDKKLNNHLDNWLDKWFQITEKGGPYYYDNSNSGWYSFILPGDAFQSEKQKNAFHALENLSSEFYATTKKLICYIKQEYKEININQLKCLT